MKRVCGVVLVATLVALTSGMPSGEPNVQSSGEPAPVLSDLIAQAQAGISNLGKELQEKLNLPDQETVINTIKNQSTTFVANVQNYITQVSEDVKAKSPELEKVWNDAKSRLSKVVDDINAQIPNAKEQASQLQAKFTDGLDVLAEEASKSAKTINQNSEKIQGDVAEIAKQMVDIVVKSTENFKNQLRELGVTEAPK